MGTSSFENDASSFSFLAPRVCTLQGSVYKGKLYNDIVIRRGDFPQDEGQGISVQ